MFDFFRNLTKSEAAKRQEKITAYLDGVLSPAERQHFEQLLAGDRALRANVDRQRVIKQQFRQLPRRKAPRNFTLDPALYGRPQSQTSARLYPYVRFATAIAGILLVVLLATDLILVSDSPEPSFFSATQADVAQEVAADESAAEPVIEVTRVVVEQIEEAEVVAEEAPAEGPLAAGEVDLGALPTEVATDGLQPTPTLDGTADPSAQTRQADDAPAAAIAEGYPAPTGQAITSTKTQGPQTETVVVTPLAVSENEVETEQINLLRFAQIGLFLTVVVLIGLTLYLRRLS